MPFAILKDETSLDDLAARLFSPDRKLSKTVAKQAAAALLKANPQLQNIDQVPPGSLVVVPSTAPPLVPSEAVEAPAPALSSAVGDARGWIDALAAQMAAMDARVQEAAQSVLALSRMKDIRLDEQDIPDLASILPGVKPSQTVVKDVEKSLKVRDETFAALRQHAASLVTE